MQVNMNHAATSPTHPQAVASAAMAYLQQGNHQNMGRGQGELASAQAALESRMELAAFFGASGPHHVIFTSGATESLNIALNGLVQKGGHVLATGLEHNAVARPLHLLQQRGHIEVTWLPVNPKGTFNPACLQGAIRRNTRLLVMTHASNVVGNVLPVEACFKTAKQNGLFTLLDAAQTAGHVPVALGRHTDAIAFTGHKGLRGLAGTGGLVLSKEAASAMCVWKAGGTGSHSSSLAMPDFLPDKFEAGTQNILGILCLRAAVAHIKQVGLCAIQAHERALTTQFLEGLRGLPVEVYGHYDAENWVPVVSLNMPGVDAGALARQLDAGYGIQTRSGLHCAPLAHKAIGTFPRGTLRFSFGASTTRQEIEYTLNALKEISCANSK